MKTLAIIVDKLPKCCAKCDYHKKPCGFDTCYGTGFSITDIFHRPKYCPLKLLPKMKLYVSDDCVALENGFIVKGASYYYKEGYNACIDEIGAGNHGYDRCNAKNETIIGSNKKREKDCPLKVEPKQKQAVTKKQTSRYDYVCHIDPYAKGWNDCLNKILGEKNENKNRN